MAAKKKSKSARGMKKTATRSLLPTHFFLEKPVRGASTWAMQELYAAMDRIANHYAIRVIKQCVAKADAIVACQDDERPGGIPEKILSSHMRDLMVKQVKRIWLYHPHRKG